MLDNIDSMFNVAAGVLGVVDVFLTGLTNIDLRLLLRRDRIKLNKVSSSISLIEMARLDIVAMLFLTFPGFSSYSLINGVHIGNSKFLS